MKAKRTEPSDLMSRNRLPSLPSDWPLVRLGDLFDIRQGKALNAKSRSQGLPLPFLRTANILWGRLDLAFVDTMGFTNKEQQALDLQNGDLLVCEGGDIGRTAIWKGEVRPCSYQNHIHRLRRKRADIEAEFYMRWMELAFRYLGSYEGESNRTTIANLSKGRLASFVVPKPKVEEQREISAALGGVQGAKEACERVIAATLQTKQGLLARIYLSGYGVSNENVNFNVAEYEFGLIPSHWGIKQLGEILTKNKAGRKESEVPMVAMADVPSGGFNVDKWEMKRVEDIRSGVPFFAGDVLLAKITPCLENGKLGVVRDGLPTESGITSTEIFPLRSDSISADVLASFLAQTPARNWLASKMQGTTGRKRLPREALEALPIPLPPKGEQEKIAIYFKAINAKIQKEGKKLASLELLFGSLLHNLLTGKVRMSFAEAESKAVVLPSVAVVAEKTTKRKSSDQFMEAVLIAAIVNWLDSSIRRPVTRFRYTKLSYMYHRFAEEDEALAEYGQYAAGPYDPHKRYGGPENIAVKRGYIRRAGTTTFKAGSNSNEALKYFKGKKLGIAKRVIEEFGHFKDDTLELWASVDYTERELAKAGEVITAERILLEWNKSLEWKKKTSKFTRDDIEKAIAGLRKVSAKMKGDLR